MHPMKRRAIRFTLLLLAVMVAIPSCLDAGAGKRKGNRQRGVAPQATMEVVTRSFDSAGAIAVPATGNSGPAGPYPSQIAVSGLAQGRLLDVDLELRGFGHTWPDDVDLLLVAPGGRDAIVMSDAGDSVDAANLTLTLDDEAAAALPDGTALASGSYRPVDHDSTTGDSDTFPAPALTPTGAVALAIFDGTDPNGTWSLYVVDDGSGDTGSIANGWALTIAAEVTTPDPPAPPPPAPPPDTDDKGKGKGKGKNDGKGKGNGKGNDKDKGKNEGKGQGNGKGNGSGGKGRGKGKGR